MQVSNGPVEWKVSGLFASGRSGYKEQGVSFEGRSGLSSRSYLKVAPMQGPELGTAPENTLCLAQLTLCHFLGRTLAYLSQTKLNPRVSDPTSCYSLRYLRMFPNFIQLLKLVTIVENWLPLPVSHESFVMIVLLSPPLLPRRTES